jgi:arylsulfatase A-like enzyme
MGSGRLKSLLDSNRIVTLAILFCTLGFAGCTRPSDKPNIVLVILDTVRSDFTGPGGNNSGLTPQLDRLADEGTVFRNTWATAPWTLPTHASIFTGMLSSAHGCHINHWRLDQTHPTLAGLLSESNYETAAFFSNPWLRDEMTGVLNGFELRRESPISTDEMSMGRSDQGGRAINRNIADWLGQRKGRKPFFLFVNYLEAHLPYDPPAAYRKQHLSDLPPGDLVSIAWSEEYIAGLHPTDSVNWARVRRLYGGDVHHADQLFSALISMLKTHEHYENSVIIVTSDHGEHLGEHNLMDHQFSVHETLLSVPLVIRAPRLLEKGVRNEPIMLIDLFASILDFADVEGENIPPLSRSMRLSADETSTAMDHTGWSERILIAEYGGGHPFLVNGLLELNPDLDPGPFKRGYRSVRWRDFRLTIATDGSAWLHDLSIDPHQSKNLIEEHPQVVEELYASMMRLSSKEFKKEDPEDVEIDEKSLKKLRSLGYIK